MRRLVRHPQPTLRRRPPTVKLPWKQNLLRIPGNIEDKISHTKHDAWLVACSLRIDLSKIQAGTYAHLGLLYENSKVIVPQQIVPPTSVGRYSKANREGREIIRKDLPKYNKTWSVTTPNYGDWSKGSHQIEWETEAYPRDFVPPKLLTIGIEQLGVDAQRLAGIFKFTVNEVLDRQSADFDSQLLFNLNLLQENVGNHDVYQSTASRDDYLRTLYVNWEILPPGEREETFQRILRIAATTDPVVRQQLRERFDVLHSLKPINFVQGTNEFRRYFGAQFAADLVVFENLEYGNAIYVMFEEWEQLSRKTRIELLASREGRFVRIPHTKTWRARLKAVVREELAKRHG